MKKTKKNRMGMTLLLLGCLLLVAVPAVAEKPTTGDPEAAYAAYQAQQNFFEKIAGIEANKAAFVQDLVAGLEGMAMENGNDDTWYGRMIAAWAGLDAETLLLMSEASNWDELLAAMDGEANFGNETSSELVFYPLTPCRVVDTRIATKWGPGVPIAAGQTITFNTYPPLNGQGGHPSLNCGVLTTASAVVMNVTAIPVSGGKGHFRVWPWTQPIPTASLINYSSTVDTNMANAVVQSQCRACSEDVNVYSLKTAHLVVDVIGYFARPTRTAVENNVLYTKTNVAANANFDIFSPPCPSGWRVTGGGFLTDFYTTPITVGSRPANGTSIDLFTGINLADRWLCQGKNGNLAQGIYCHVVCSRIPGR